MTLGKTFLFRMAVAVMFLAARSLAHAEESRKTILFVCEHGTVKSLIAASFFNRLAAERKIDYQAIARGTAPEAAIPPAIAAKLEQDGFDLSSFSPQILTGKDADRSVRIIAFCEIPPDRVGAAEVTSWLDVPPATVDYEKAKAVMLPRIEALVAALKSK